MKREVKERYNVINIKEVLHKHIQLPYYINFALISDSLRAFGPDVQYLVMAKYTWSPCRGRRERVEWISWLGRPWISRRQLPRNVNNIVFYWKCLSFSLSCIILYVQEVFTHVKQWVTILNGTSLLGHTVQLWFFVGFSGQKIS